ncbi:MAG: hypothetical protein HRT71_18720 [Flavobacteriales bacterium]|nr:hypothetical protein [Flavobacteriales bacterium]
MESNKQMIKRIASYSTVAAAVLASAGNANAEIIYTDVADLQLSLGGTVEFEIDLDGDGDDDFIFYVAVPEAPLSSQTAYVAAQGISYSTSSATNVFKASNRLIVKNIIKNSSSSALGLALGSSDTIGASDSNSIIGGLGFATIGTSTWIASTAGSWGWPVGGNKWMEKVATSSSSFSYMGKADKYFGAKFDISGATHYAWIKASLTTSAQSGFALTFHGFAYNTVAGEAIPTGELVGISARKETKADVYSFGKNIHVKTDKGSSVQVYNLAGQEVYNGVTKGALEKIDMRGHNGMHIVKVGNTSKKVYIN